MTTSIRLPAGLDSEHESAFHNEVRLGREGSLQEIQDYLQATEYEINGLLMLNTIAACYGRADIVCWILSNTQFHVNPDTNKQEYILKFIIVNNQAAVLQTCLANERMLTILKASETATTLWSAEEGPIEVIMACLDLAILDAAEQGSAELVQLLYPHVTNKEYDTAPHSVKHNVLLHSIQWYDETKSNAWFAMLQTVLADESYDPSFPHDNEPLMLAIHLTNITIVSHLLHHPRIRICEDTLDDHIMSEVTNYANSPNGLEIFKLFLADERFTPSRDANQIIHALTDYGAEYNAALEYITTSCPSIRWDWFGWPTPLTNCVKLKNLEGIKILLAQPKYDPCMRENEAAFAAEELMDTHPEIMMELLNDTRIATSYNGKGVQLKAKIAGERCAVVKGGIEEIALAPDRVWNWYLSEDEKQTIGTTMKQ